MPYKHFALVKLMWPGDLEMNRWKIGLSLRILTIIKATAIAVW